MLQEKQAEIQRLSKYTSVHIWAGQKI